MNSIYSELVTSPFALSVILLHLVVLAQCAIKFVDHILTKQQLEKLNQVNKEVKLPTHFYL